MPRSSETDETVAASAAHVLIQSYVDIAGEEALLRALIAERGRDHERARFWAGVYERISRPFPQQDGG